MPTDSENQVDTQQRDEAAARFRGYLAMAAELEVGVLASDETPAATISGACDQPNRAVVRKRHG